MQKQENTEETLCFKQDLDPAVDSIAKAASIKQT